MERNQGAGTGNVRGGWISSAKTRRAYKPLSPDENFPDTEKGGQVTGQRRLEKESVIPDLGKERQILFRLKKVRASGMTLLVEAGYRQQTGIRLSYLTG